MGEKFADVIDNLTKAKEQYVEAGKQAIKPAILDFIAAHPEVHAIRWTQYTPYFNDGDPCEFRVCEPTVQLYKAGTTEPDEEEGDDEDGFRDSWSLNREGHAALAKDLESLHELFGAAEEAVRGVFGEHSQVTVGRDGEAEIEEYDHD